MKDALEKLEKEAHRLAGVDVPERCSRRRRRRRERRSSGDDGGAGGGPASGGEKKKDGGVIDAEFEETST